jgi:hypothetical protein
VKEAKRKSRKAVIYAEWNSRVTGMLANPTYIVAGVSKRRDADGAAQSEKLRSRVAGKVVESAFRELVCYVGANFAGPASRERSQLDSHQTLPIERKLEPIRWHGRRRFGNDFH